MPVSKRAPTMPVEALSQIVGSPVPGLKDILIGRQVVKHIGVSPEMKRGEIEVEDGRPMRGQAHEVDIRRSYGQPYPEIDDSDPTWIPYATHQLAPSNMKDLDYIEDLGPARARLYMQRMLRLSRRTLLLAEEAEIAALMFTAANWGANTVGLAALPGGSGNLFGAAGALEFSDMSRARDAAALTYGNEAPTDLTIGYGPFQALRRSTENRTWVGSKTTIPVIPDDELIAMIIAATGVQRLHIGRARAETAISGAASAQANIWGNHLCFHWYDVDTSDASGGVSTQGGTALGIYLDRKARGAVDGYWGQQIVKDDAPVVKMVAGVDRTARFLNETDTSTGAALPPRGFLLTTCA